MKKDNPHILIVDDDNRIRELIKQYLKDKDFITSTAQDAESAKKLIEQFKFDLIVLDVMMPGQDGFELTKEIKKKLSIPIILLTAKGEVENRIQGLELGADDYLGKPFDPKELLLRIKNIISKNKKININEIKKVGKKLAQIPDEKRVKAIARIRELAKDVDYEELKELFNTSAKKIGTRLAVLESLIVLIQLNKVDQKNKEVVAYLEEMKTSGNELLENSVNNL